MTNWKFLAKELKGENSWPPAIPMLISSSKIFQTHLFGEFMTMSFTVESKHDLMESINAFKTAGIETVVSKEDRSSGGFGVCRWDNLEHLYCVRASNVKQNPIVLQEYIPEYNDIRVILVGNYAVAYERKNCNENFRNNLTQGGIPNEVLLNKKQFKLCKNIMELGQFPYAHIDLMVTKDKNYFSEICLSGGIEGAPISHTELASLKERVKHKLQSERNQNEEN